ncbi:MAG: DsbA family protein [Flavobacteriaceae bacterium]
MKRIVLAALALACTLVFLPAAGMAGAKPLDDAGKAEIEKVVRDYLLKNPEVIEEALQELEKRKQEKEVAETKDKLRDNRDALENSPLSYVAGNPDGDVTIVEFFDYNCGYCRRAMADLQKLMENDPKLRVVFKEFPILREESLDAAKVSVAAMLQGKYLQFHFAMMESPGLADMDRAMQVAEKIGLDMDRVKRDIASDDILAPIRESHRLADAFGLQGTPSYFVGDEVVMGAVGYDELKAKIDSARSNGCLTC